MNCVVPNVMVLTLED